MTPSIAPPAPEVLSQLLTEHARRFPEKRSADVIGDRGAIVSLPLLIANPTGTTGRPDALPVWADTIATNMGAMHATGAALSDALVRDCLLYPGRGLLAQWEERWPVIVEELALVVLGKLGARESVLEPAAGTPAPESIAGHLEANQSALWRWLQCGDGKPVPAVVLPPSRAYHEGLTAAVKRDGADCVALLAEMMSLHVKGDGVAALIQQYPGVALPLYRLVNDMGGKIREARKGGW